MLRLGDGGEVFARLGFATRRFISLGWAEKNTCHVFKRPCDQGYDGTAYRSAANPKGNIMKTLLIAAALVATSFTAMADNHDSLTQEAASGPGKTRAEVIAELNEAKAAGLIYLTDSEMRHAESLSRQQSTSNLTRHQVRQEVVALREQTKFDIQGDHR